MAEQATDQEVNQDNLRADLMKDVKGEKANSGKQPWEIRMDEDHPELVEPKKKELEPEEVKEEPKKEEVPEEKPDSEEQPAETESQPAEEQPEEEAQPAEATKDTAKEDAYIAEYAKKTGLSQEDAKAEVESLRAISKKYNDDPVKLAKAYREVQSAYDKQKVTASSNINPAVQAIVANPRSFVAGEFAKNSEKLINEFREQNPARSRDMDDEQVSEEVIERGTFAIKNKIKDYEITLKKDASNKREEMIRGMKEADRSLLPEIKPILEQLPDHQVVGSGFKFEDLVYYAKGKSVDRLVKEAEDRIHKQYAVKDRKIVGEISKPSQTTKVKQTPEQSKSTGMSKWQKDQAIQMFASSPMSDDEKYEAYLEVTKKKK